jgi:hypothetical protein
MKGTLFIVLLLAALIVGFLVISNLTTEDQAGVSNVERLDRARETADTAEKTLENVRKLTRQATDPGKP